MEKAAINDKRWLSPEEAAEYIGVAVSTLYRWRKEDRLQFYRLGARVSRIKREDLDALAEPQTAGRTHAQLQEWAEEAEALYHELYEKYGVGDDSAVFLREARRAREQHLGRE